MFRATSLVIKRSKVLLWRINPIELRVACLSSSPVLQKHIKKAGERERDPCPQPPPPPPKLRDDKRFWGAVLLLLMTGGFAAYAKTNPELRDWLTISANWFDDFIAVLHRENYGYLEQAIFFVDSCKQYIAKLLESQEECTVDAPPPPANVALKDGEDDDDDDDDDDRDENEEEEESPCEILLPPVITTDVCELEACLRDLGDTIVANLITARDACVVYNEVIRDTMLEFSIPKLRQLGAARDERQDLVERHMKNVEMAMPSFNDIPRYVDCGCKVPGDRLDMTRQILKDYQDMIRRLQIECEIEHDLSEKYEALAKIIEAKMNIVTGQNVCVYQGLDYDHRIHLEGDPDYLFIQTLKILTILKAELEDSMKLMSSRVATGVGMLPYKKEDLDKKVQEEYKKGLSELEKEFQARIAHMIESYELETKRKLVSQKQKNEEQLAIRLVKQEKEMSTNIEKMIQDAVTVQKNIFTSQLRELEAQLQLVEGSLNDKLKAERETKRAQLLYSAAVSMLQATKKGGPYVKVNKELELLEKESGFESGDKLVMTVLNAIPYEVKIKGIVPESIIKEKFKSMEDIALKVSMIENEGAPLVLYMISWLQSVFLCMKLRSIPQCELDHPPKEPFDNLDTFDLLQRARYFMEQGNLAGAVQYVNALKGASRGAAQAWYNIANNHLQTKLAAEAIVAHAAAMSVQYL